MEVRSVATGIVRDFDVVDYEDTCCDYVCRIRRMSQTCEKLSNLMTSCPIKEVDEQTTAFFEKVGCILSDGRIQKLIKRLHFDLDCLLKDKKFLQECFVGCFDETKMHTTWKFLQIGLFVGVCETIPTYFHYVGYYEDFSVSTVVEIYFYFKTLGVTFEKQMRDFVRLQHADPK